jgi:hypothetical protein
MWKEFRILGSGFTKEEYDLYEFGSLEDPSMAMNYLSNRLNHEIFSPKLNQGYHKHILEDKWLTHNILKSLGIPIPRTIGLYHPDFGMTCGGSTLTSGEDILNEIKNYFPCKLFFKPRGGRQGRNLIKGSVYLDDKEDKVLISSHGKVSDFIDFIESLSADAYREYDGNYHGWIVQFFIEQHDFLNKLNPDTVNTLRVVTLIDSHNKPHVCFSVLRVGRKGGIGDNWSTGGIAVSVDPDTGMLGQGVFMPKFGGGKINQHPDSGQPIDGLVVPEWDSVLSLCKRVAIVFSGIKSIGLDIALTPQGPIVVEGNADWCVPLIQFHIKGGLLTPEYRKKLAGFGAFFPDDLAPLHKAFFFLLNRRWRQSRWPNLIRAFRNSGFEQKNE